MGRFELFGDVRIFVIVPVPVVSYGRRVDGYRGCAVRVGPMTADGVRRVGHYCRVLVATGAVVEHDDVVPVPIRAQ